MASRSGGLFEPRELGPGRLGVDMIGRDGRDAAPVVDAGVEQAWKLCVCEVRRGLQCDLVGQDQPRDGDRPEVVVERRLGRVGHLRIGFGAEVLDDYLLQVPAPSVQAAQCEQCLDALAARLANADQNATRRWDLQLAHAIECVEPCSRFLVGRAVVRHALLAQAGTGGLQHDPLRWSEPAQLGKFGAVEHTGVGVRQQTRLLEHGTHAFGQIRGGRQVAQLGELAASRLVTQFGLVTKRKQRLSTAGGLAQLGDRDNLIDRHVIAFVLAGRLGKGAVVADVAAEDREGNEDLRRVRDNDATCRIAAGARSSAEGGEIRRGIVREREGLSVGQHPDSLAPAVV